MIRHSGSDIKAEDGRTNSPVSVVVGSRDVLCREVIVEWREVERMGLQEAEGMHMAGSLPQRGGSLGGPQVMRGVG